MVTLKFLLDKTTHKLRTLYFVVVNTNNPQLAYIVAMIGTPFKDPPYVRIPVRILMVVYLTL